MRIPLLCKSGVRFAGFTWGLTKILEAVADLNDPARYAYIPPLGLVITSGSDGAHQKTPPSRHYSFEAIDIRTLDFPGEAAKLLFCVELSRRLNRLDPPERFTVFLEHHGKPNEHIHVQVRKGMTFP